MSRGLTLKPALDGIERWMDEKGPGGKSFRESLEAGGVIAADLVAVAGAVNGMLHCGLTRDALVLLISAKCKGKTAGGRPLPLTTIDDVLTAMENLHTFIEDPPKKASK